MHELQDKIAEIRLAMSTNALGTIGRAAALAREVVALVTGRPLTPPPAG